MTKCYNAIFKIFECRSTLIFITFFWLYPISSVLNGSVFPVTYLNETYYVDHIRIDCLELPNVIHSHNWTLLALQWKIPPVKAFGN